jgi:hypothetical protein
MLPEVPVGRIGHEEKYKRRQVKITSRKKSINKGKRVAVSEMTP